jgi:signal transduction histidine kinase
MMKWDAPETLLALFLATAVLCLAGGTRLAREEIRVEEARSRSAHEPFIKRLDHELDRLEKLYQSHLRRLCSIKNPNDLRPIEDLGRKIVGVAQFSYLSASVTSQANYHLPMNDSKDLPAPAFAQEAVPLGREGILLDAETLRDPAREEGWIDEPGKPLFYWHQRPDRRVVVLLIDPLAVREAMNAWLGEWLGQEFEPVHLLGGPDRLEDPSGRVLATVGLETEDASSRPEAMLSVPSRFGSWRLASLGRSHQEIHYRMPVLVVSGLLAGIFVLLGAVVYLCQRRAVRLAKTRVSFVNQVSHELRSPLTNILLNADLAQDAAEDNPLAQRRLRLIQDEAHRLGRLIANVLTFSRRESGSHRLQLEPVGVDAVIDEVLDQFAPMLERHAIEVKHDQGVAQKALLDHDALFQIVANLVSNVEKYGVSGKELKITTSSASGRLRVCVSDKGPGVKPRDRGRIFESFVRLDDRVSEGVTGTGLGLSIARGLAEDMGGSLTLLASEEGASFELQLPWVAVAEPILS